MIRGTVALPVYNSNKILWLALESLCRQVKPVDGWELIVYEEMHMTQAGEGYVRRYEDRLREAGCERIEYLTSDVKIPLSWKWVTIARHASETSEYFCLCAADNYYSPWMLCDVESVSGQFDWFVVHKGYFYDFHFHKVIYYDYLCIPPLGLQMAARTELVRGFPLEEKNRAVDTWVTHKIWEKLGKGNVRVFVDASEHYQRILCTNGLNNISTGRHKYFEDPKPPFHPTEKELIDIVPEDIFERLVQTRNILHPFWVNDDLG